MTDDLRADAPRRARLGQRFVVCAVVAFQVLVPGALLVFGDRPASFGWQMYSIVGERPEITVAYTDGTTSSLEPRDLRINRRGIRIDHDLLTRACALDSEITKFHIRQHGSSTTHECPR